LLLQILDDGRLTDSKGRTVSFKNAVIILTSNVGAAVAQSERTGVYGFGSEESERGDGGASQRQYEGMKDNITKALKEKFRLEFLNRLDETVIFKPLQKAEIVKIVELFAKELAERLAEQGLGFTLTDRAKEYIVENGYDPVYGARPLKRAVIRELETPVSRLLIEGKLQNGGELQVDADEKGLKFNCLPPVEKE
jgi:ATP-dependent Clp protease ATP-binding subunit ClpC